MGNNKKSNSNSNSEQNLQSEQPKEKPLKIPRVPKEQRVKIEKGDESKGLTKK